MTLKSTLLAGSLMLAASSIALAQTSPAPAPQKPPAAGTQKTPPAAGTQGGQQMWYSSQQGDMRASKVIGTNVVNTANENIGEVNEILLGKDGEVAAVVIGVGGFLGMGEREVAVNFESLKMSRDQNQNLVLTLNANKDTLKSAPEWRWSEANK